ncbi:MAG: ATP synthase F1 subunit epsilon [Elusimicrobia bacterium]|nr:ATP synthase F1 subunit epsilon [Elusimicrobiota bacterium]
MAKKQLTLRLVTPERVVQESSGVDFVVLPAYAGEMGILPGHAPFFVQLQEGSLRTHRGEDVNVLAISGGFVEIHGDVVSVFAETAEMAEEIDAERARQALEKAKAQMVSPNIDPLTLAQAEAAARRAAVRLKVAELRRTTHSSSRS